VRLAAVLDVACTPEFALLVAGAILRREVPPRFEAVVCVLRRIAFEAAAAEVLGKLTRGCDTCGALTDELTLGGLRFVGVTAPLMGDGRGFTLVRERCVAGNTTGAALRRRDVPQLTRGPACGEDVAFEPEFEPLFAIGFPPLLGGITIGGLLADGLLVDPPEPEY